MTFRYFSSKLFILLFLSVCLINKTYPNSSAPQPSLKNVLATDGASSTIDGLKFQLNHQTWVFGVSKQLFGREIPLFQSVSMPSLVGNVSSVLKVTPANEEFHPLKVTQKQCQYLAQIYLELNRENPPSLSKQYEVFQVLKVGPDQVPYCVIHKVQDKTIRSLYLMNSPRVGPYSIVSYMAHTFTFNYPLKDKEKAQEALRLLMSQMRFVHLK